MKGKAFILAGGSGGLGAAVAHLIAEQGGIPVIGCRSNRDRAETLAADLHQRHRVQAPIVVGDILDEAVRRQLITAAESVGKLYGLVPLVGSPARVMIEKATEADIADSMSVNFVGPVLLARDFVAHIGERDGSIVFVSTMQGVAVFPNSAVYAAPKAALVHTARILAKQWNIRVNVVAPGVNDAGMAEQSIRSGKYNSFLERKIIPRFGQPADVARAIVFFLTPDNYVTGQVLTIDGGLSLKM